MGANFVTWYGGDCDTATLKKKFEDFQSEEISQYGNDGYAGHLGIVNGLNITNRKFDTEDDAEEWLMYNASKWESAEAVQYKGTVKKLGKTSQTITERYNRLKKELDEFDSVVLKEIKSAKSKTTGCKCCGSSISRKHLKGLDCPICYSRKEFMNDTRKKQKNRLEERVIEARGKAQNQKDKAKDTAGYVWLVGGTCPC